jgi:hypothetical protein
MDAVAGYARKDFRCRQTLLFLLVPRRTMAMVLKVTVRKVTAAA